MSTRIKELKNQIKDLKSNNNTLLMEKRELYGENLAYRRIITELINSNKTQSLDLARMMKRGF